MMTDIRLTPLYVPSVANLQAKKNETAHCISLSHFALETAFVEQFRLIFPAKECVGSDASASAAADVAGHVGGLDDDVSDC